MTASSIHRGGSDLDQGCDELLGILDHDGGHEPRRCGRAIRTKGDARPASDAGDSPCPPQRQFDGIQVETDYDAVSYGGWFTRERAGNLIPIAAPVVAFSTAQGKSPRYTPIGILRFGGRSIWVMSEWGIESETIVLFDVAAKGVRKLTSALVSGC